MIQIRKNLFETNSSSTHAVCVSRTMNDPDPSRFYSLGDRYCFGRCESQLVESWSEKLAYAYIVVHCLHNWDKVKKTRDTSNDLENFKNMAYEVAKDYFIEPKDEFESHIGFTESNFMRMFDTIEKMMEDYDAYVDHIEDFADNGFYEKLVTDKEFIRRLVFDEDSYITVGGDEYRGYNIKTIGFQYDYDYSYNKDVKREFDDENYYKWIDPADYYVGEFWDKVKKYRENFDVFFKGN